MHIKGCFIAKNSFVAEVTFSLQNHSQYYLLHIYMLQIDRGMGRDFENLKNREDHFGITWSLNVVFTASELESAIASS